MLTTEPTNSVGWIAPGLIPAISNQQVADSNFFAPGAKDSSTRLCTRQSQPSFHRPHHCFPNADKTCFTLSRVGRLHNEVKGITAAMMRQVDPASLALLFAFPLCCTRVMSHIVSSASLYLWPSHWYLARMPTPSITSSDTVFRSLCRHDVMPPPSQTAHCSRRHHACFNARSL
jgi:hypothetical protein